MPGEIEITDEMRAAFANVRRQLHGLRPLAVEEVSTALSANEIEQIDDLISAIAPLISRAAYERGQRDMREKAAKVADAAPSGAYRSRAGQCHEAIAAAIRALPTGGENG